MSILQTENGRAWLISFKTVKVQEAIQLDLFKDSPIKEFKKSPVQIIIHKGN